MWMVILEGDKVLIFRYSQRNNGGFKINTKSKKLVVTASLGSQLNIFFRSYDAIVSLEKKLFSHYLKSLYHLMQLCFFVVIVDSLVGK